MESLRNKNEVTSLELLKEINRYREMEYNYKVENELELGKVELKNGRYTELKHNDLLKIIRDEFEEEITQGKISLSEYKDNTGKKNQMYIITLEQAKQLLMRESKYVRKGVLEYIHKLENKLKEFNNVMILKKYEPTEYEKDLLRLEKAKLFKELSESVKIQSYKDILQSYSANTLANEYILPLPKIEQLSYSATEICKMLLDRYDLKVTVQKLGRIANKENLKVEDNGVWVLNKKKYSNGTTETFRYYEKMVEVFYKLIMEDR